MPVPTAVTDLSSTAASNSPAGSENPFPDLDNYIRALSAFIKASYDGTLTAFLTNTADGRLYGTALHNNAGAVTGTTNQYIASGTYTPTLTNVTNMDGATANANATWIRVGNVVMVAAVININPTAASTTTSLGISLPIASDLTAGSQLCGQAAREPLAAGQISAAVTGDATNNRAQLDYYNDSTVLSSNWTVNFQYVVV